MKFVHTALKRFRYFLKRFGVQYVGLPVGTRTVPEDDSESEYLADDPHLAEIAPYLQHK